MKDIEVEYKKIVSTEDEVKATIFESFKSVIDTMRKGDLRTASVSFDLLGASIDCKVTLRD